jgi:hypothetical protein
LIIVAIILTGTSRGNLIVIVLTKVIVAMLDIRIAHYCSFIQWKENNRNIDLMPAIKKLSKLTLHPSSLSTNNFKMLIKYFGKIFWLKKIISNIV